MSTLAVDAPSTQAIVLAAGRSTRVKTKASKLTFPFCGKEMILYPTEIMQNLSIPLIMVVGYQKEIIQDILTRKGITAQYVEQKNPKGTGHAVMVSQSLWQADNLLIINGDNPLLNEAMIKGIIEKHVSSHATITFITANNTDATLSVAHVLKNEDGKIRVVEHNEFEGDRSQPYIMNAGIYIMKKSFLETHIDKIPPYKNGELGIPQLIHMAVDENQKVETFDVPLDYVRGVNTQKELSIAEHIKRSELITYWMGKGVRFIDENSTIIDADVELTADTIIGAGVHILKGSKVGPNCVIGAYSIIDKSIIENDVTIGSHSVLTDAHIPAKMTLKPFSTSEIVSGCTQTTIAL